MIRRLVTSTYRRLVPAPVHRTLRAWTLLDRPVRPRVIGELNEPRVLVLAPHSDDEAIGCGGTMRRHVQAGAKVVVVYLTDGTRGRPPGDTIDAPAFVELREREAKEAAALLGTNELIFLRAPDSALEPTPPLVERLKSIIEQVQPAVIYCPWILDGHHDHFAANELLHAAMTRGCKCDAAYRGYEVWTPLAANVIVDITSVASVKWEAVAKFASQTATCDYPRLAQSLNGYRSLFSGGNGFAEAFYQCTMSEFLELFHTVSRRPRHAVP